jgi:hypothetical protein
MGPGLRRDDKNYSRGAMRPKFCISLALRKSEGAGKTGCAPHPRSRAQYCKGMLRPSIQVWRKPPAFPAQWLYGLYVIVLVTGFLATIVGFSFRFRQLDASTGASDPNDFAVRNSPFVSRAAASTAPCPSFATMAYAPWRDGMRGLCG